MGKYAKRDFLSLTLTSVRRKILSEGECDGKIAVDVRLSASTRFLLYGWILRIKFHENHNWNIFEEDFMRNY